MNWTHSSWIITKYGTAYAYTVVPALGDPRRERPPAVYGHVINAPTDTFQR